VIDDQEDHGADNRHKEAIKIQIRHPCVSEQISEETSDNCSDHAQEDIAVPAVMRLVYDSAADESGDHTQDNPADEREGRILPPIGKKKKTQSGDIDDRHVVSAPAGFRFILAPALRAVEEGRRHSPG
jgi:hypothetical protein